jgi:predicted NUDIX family NTP pyrophosphohydrolase
MAPRSAGLLPYRFGVGRVLEMLIVHPGGPFWAKKDDGSWSVAKGEYESGEDPMDAAAREFAEELGVAPPEGPLIDLGEIKQSGGKLVRVWAVEGDVAVEVIESNRFELEWPPRSGETRTFPEIDRAEWVSAATARRKLLKGQASFVDRLVAQLEQSGKIAFSQGQ